MAIALDRREAVLIVRMIVRLPAGVLLADDVNVVPPSAYGYQNGTLPVYDNDNDNDSD